MPARREDVPTSHARRLAVLDSPLATLLVETFDNALTASYHSFAFALAAILESRLTDGAEILLRPILRAITRLIGSSWRPWAVVAAIGLLLRGRLPRRMRSGIHRHGHGPWLRPAGDNSTEGDVRRQAYAHRFSEFDAEGESGEAMPLALRPSTTTAMPMSDGSGTWYFVPSPDRRTSGSYRDELGRGGATRHPLLLQEATDPPRIRMSRL
jgi:hypothetical protein